MTVWKGGTQLIARTKYTIFGALFGACFPIVGTLVYTWLNFYDLSPASLLRAQSGNVLLWIIDTAPFWLGLFARSVGHREDALRRVIEDRESTIAARTEDLELALENAEVAARAKGRFLANMSHEIRTPMTAILGFAEMLQEPELADARRDEMVQIIHTNGQHLLQVINDILDFSKIEAGKMTIESIPCSPRTMVIEVARLMELHAQHKALEFRVGCCGPLPETIHSDPTRIRQILLNLVGNAIKFTEQGSVCLSVRYVDDGAEPALEFAVRDTGIGMTPDQIERLFHSFSQADDSTSRKYGGTGLGLSVCKRLVDLMAGSCAVESTVGEGSTFAVTLPTGDLTGVPISVSSAEDCCRTEPAPPTMPGASDLVDRSILLAEDIALNARFIRAILERNGAVVEVAENGLVAVERCLEQDRVGMPFDIVLMDIQMPEMDGYEATRHLRTAGHDGPILALTANAMPSDRQACLDAGCNGWATKPVDRAELVAQIQQLTEDTVKI